MTLSVHVPWVSAGQRIVLRDLKSAPFGGVSSSLTPSTSWYQREIPGLHRRLRLDELVVRHSVRARRRTSSRGAGGFNRDAEDCSLGFKKGLVVDVAAIVGALEVLELVDDALRAFLGGAFLLPLWRPWRSEQVVQGHTDVHREHDHGYPQKLSDHRQILPPEEVDERCNQQQEQGDEDCHPHDRIQRRGLKHRLGQNLDLHRRELVVSDDA